MPRCEHLCLLLLLLLLLARDATRVGSAILEPSAAPGACAQLKELGVSLPTPAAPKGSYVLCRRVGAMLYTGAGCRSSIVSRALLLAALDSTCVRCCGSAAGHLPQRPDGTLFTGKARRRPPRALSAVRAARPHTRVLAHACRWART